MDTENINTTFHEIVEIMDDINVTDMAKESNEKINKLQNKKIIMKTKIQSNDLSFDNLNESNNTEISLDTEMITTILKRCVGK